MSWKIKKKSPTQSLNLGWMACTPWRCALLPFIVHPATYILGVRVERQLHREWFLVNRFFFFGKRKKYCVKFALKTIYIFLNLRENIFLLVLQLKSYKKTLQKSCGATDRWGADGTRQTISIIFVGVAKWCSWGHLIYTVYSLFKHCKY